MSYDPQRNALLIRETDNRLEASHTEREYRNQLQAADDEVARLQKTIKNQSFRSGFSHHILQEIDSFLHPNLKRELVRLLNEFARMIDAGTADETISEEWERLSAEVTKHCNEAKTTAVDQVETLQRWKAEQLAVTAWWAEIDAFIRAHPDAPLGESVAKTALAWLKDRDDLKAGINDMLAKWNAL